MALEDLLAADTVTVQQRQPKRQDASGGIAAGGWQTVYAAVPARVEDVGANMQMAYATRGMVVSTKVYTQQQGVGVGWLVLTADGRKLVVNGVTLNRALGGLPAYVELLCEEYRPGA